MKKDRLIYEALWEIVVSLEKRNLLSSQESLRLRTILAYLRPADPLWKRVINTIALGVLPFALIVRRGK